ncbi:MAG: hypothetical protein IT338_14850 [Thermomicrobiales bacterium]|nr:hypothetical protein [Thermomicrobiales bacterium]
MDSEGFDALTRTTMLSSSRRGALVGFALGALGFLRSSGDVAAVLGCKSAGKRCRKSAECCEGICKGKKKRRRCRRRVCKPGQTFNECGGVSLTCTSVEGNLGTCATTTSNKGYCASGVYCIPCTTDADCVSHCGPHAACLDCAIYCGAGKACAGPAACS